jgi:hypothetical protein
LTTINRKLRIYFHSDSSGLFVFAGVEVTYLPSELGGDDPVRGEETVGQRCLAVVDVG